VDAHKGELSKGYTLSKCIPDAGTGFSTHQLEPESVLYLCQQLYGALPHVFIFCIQGYEWELREGLSLQARDNLERALVWFRTQPILATSAH
jgi:hypothetical protein